MSHMICIISTPIRAGYTFPLCVCMSLDNTHRMCNTYQHRNKRTNLLHPTNLSWQKVALELKVWLKIPRQIKLGSCLRGNKRTAQYKVKPTEFICCSFQWDDELSSGFQTLNSLSSPESPWVCFLPTSVSLILACYSYTSQLCALTPPLQSVVHWKSSTLWNVDYVFALIASHAFFIWMNVNCFLALKN